MEKRKTKKGHHSEPLLTEWLKHIAEDIWKRIGFVRNHRGFRIYEPTVTQNLLYSFSTLSNDKSLPIQLFESTSESANGNDLEIAIEVNEGYVLLPCQAKNLWKRDKYERMSHKVRGRFQLELLQEYAAKIKGIPIYLLYNW